MYCTLDDLKKSLPERILLQLTDDENAGSFAVEPPNQAYARILDAVNASDVLIDGYLSGRYELPFASVPELVKQISVNLTVCNLYERNHEAVLPEAIADRRKRFIKTLEALQGGTVILPGQIKSEPAEYITNKTDADRMFSDDLLKRY